MARAKAIRLLVIKNNGRQQQESNPKSQGAAYTMYESSTITVMIWHFLNPFQLFTAGLFHTPTGLFHKTQPTSYRIIPQLPLVVTTRRHEDRLLQQRWSGYSITRVSNCWITYRDGNPWTRRMYRDTFQGPDRCSCILKHTLCVVGLIDWLLDRYTI
jgi:hypothetical protein